ncbi:MAG: cardiolipin synthase [Proteobacteria bacterium]|jgi:cardiolipin synthase|nr:cardiolipin synthase [Pseudomonadota bacterium]
MSLISLSFALHLLLVLALGARILLRDDPTPDTRLAWIVVIVLLPYLGAVLYLLLGEVRLGRRATGQYRRVRDVVREQLADDRAAARVMGAPANVEALIAPPWRGVFRYGESVNGFAPVAGNQGQLMADGETARARMLADMDAAREQINVLYYIWLDDDTGSAVAQALMRAARRGVRCRAMVDGLGSRAFLRSPLWREMREAGVRLGVALPIDRPLRVMLQRRIDLRNHRKITLIDGHTTYVGSQNCADAAFRIKAKFAPWVDIMLRLQGPVVTQMQLLFASDWMQATGEGLDAFTTPAPAWPGGFPALVVGEGPTERRRSTPQLVSTLIAGARQCVTLSTPYFVPDATVLEALCAAAWRGVRVTLIFPRRNDSWIVAGASRSHYLRLLTAGAEIHEYHGGLLHAKTLTVDDELSFMGSTNLDLRSFDLNFENNVLLQDAATTGAVTARQRAYMAHGAPVTLEQVRAWPWPRRMWNNILATLGPVL